MCSVQRAVGQAKLRVMRPRCFWRSLRGWVALPGLVLALLTGSAKGQIDAVHLEIDRDFIGIGGVVRPGTWTPIRLTLQSQAAENRAVHCRWLLNDYDGDVVMAQRLVTLNPHRDQYVWLYGVPPVNVRPGRAWTIQVVDQTSGRLLVSRQVTPPEMISPRAATIGVGSSASLGLEPYSKQYTQHEALHLLRGIDLTTLPDRWYGLSVMQALIWTRQGGDPGAAGITASMQQALREWVRRGGHLVIVLPEVGEPWTGSPLADLLPVTSGMMRQIEGLPPREGFLDVLSDEPLRVAMTVFDGAEQAGLAVLQRTQQGDPIVVAGRYGFGRVTVLGVDLSQTALANLNVPSGRFRVWNTIFGWNTPVMSEDVAQLEMQHVRMSRPDNRSLVELGAFVPAIIAMTGTAATAMLLAISVFFIYWLAAGPVGFAVLRHRGAVRYSWLGFVAVVVVFSTAAWGGAWLLQPGTASIAHFSVLDVDGRSGQVRVHSWLSLFVPEFGRAEVALGSEGSPLYNTLSSAGLFSRPDDAGFLDSQSYAVDVAAPGRVAIPVRSTAKQFEAQYLGPLTDDLAGVTTAWVAPQGALRIDPATRFPSGDLQHDLPGTLENVLVVFCPAGGTTADARPWVWRLPTPWPARTTLKLRAPVEMGVQAFDRLVKRPPDYDRPRQWSSEGFLGQLMGAKAGQSLVGIHDPFAVTMADNQRVELIELLTFYDALPPPDYRRTDFSNPTVSYQRSIGRALDLTPLTVAPGSSGTRPTSGSSGGRVILIGHLEGSPLPLPLTVDDEAVESSGWTVVRWIYDL